MFGCAFLTASQRERASGRCLCWDTSLAEMPPPS